MPNTVDEGRGGMKCHFVYSVPFTYSMGGGWFEHRLRVVLNNMGLPVSLLKKRQPDSKDMDSWPVKSPYENTRNLYLALSSVKPTILYHLTEKVHCRLRPGDVFLGHPYFPHRDGRYGVTEIAEKIASSSIRLSKFAMISPLHCDTSIKTKHINADFLSDIDKLMPTTDVLFAIMGEYWWNRWDYSPYSHWKPKMVRLDMAVDVSRYPRVKKRFNKPGHRGYLYIGENDPRKGTEFLIALMRGLGDYPKGWIGYGPGIPGIPRISSPRNLDPAFIGKIAEGFDIFISPSKADPNPTTILESMAWGFPVVCTPQSGYYETSYRRNIFLNDLDRSIEVLRSLQYVDERELRKMADEARETVMRDYTWDKFTSIVISHLGF